VIADGPSGSHTVSITSDGRYTIKLSPGTYTVTGTSPGYLDGKSLCFATANVTVKRGQTSNADVFCHVR
jgi:hypothetical protein